jgi:large subunit ribosomal protein L17
VNYKKIRTTVCRAKEARSFADRMIQIAKDGNLSARRHLIAELGCPDTADKLIRQIAPQFKSRKGGYTRVLRLGSRPGDAAEMALLEFTEVIELPKKEKKARKSKKEKDSDADSQPHKGDVVSAEKQKKGADAASGKAPATDKEKSITEDKKDSEKKGGFLGKLRKFLKGD